MNKMQTEPIAAADAPEAPRTGRLRSADGGRIWTRTILLLIVPALLVIGGAYLWLTSGGSVSTDDAQVKQDIVSVSPQVNGQIVQVFVRNGSRVRRGDILFKIDPQPYRVALEQAEAQLASAQLQTHVLKTTAAGTGGDIIGAEANLKVKQNALARQTALLKQGFTTRSDYDTAYNDVRSAEAQLADARARAANASAAVAPNGNQPQVAQAQAAVDKAKLDLSRTDVRASMDGVIENADKLQVGQMAVEGVGMVSLVHSTSAWVEANFKEKEVGRMVPGERATIQVDAYGGEEVGGHVQNLRAGTWRQVSLLAAQECNRQAGERAPPGPVRVRVHV